MMIPNPPWVDRILTKYWKTIERRIGPERMPDGMFLGKRKKRFEHAEELGCGHYGCVLETVLDPEVVFKLTSDSSEAAFVVAAMSLPEQDWPVGMIRYFDIFEIPGEKHYRRQVYGLVRQVAYEVGASGYMGRGAPSTWQDRYGIRSIKEGTLWLLAFREHAHKVRSYLAPKNAEALRTALRQIEESRRWAWGVQRERDDWPSGRNIEFSGATVGYTGAKRAAIEIERCAVAAEMMANIHFTQIIGEALDYYLEQGILLADVHLNNIGEAVVEAQSSDWDVVITDPGHMVPIQQKWMQVQVPVLKV